MASVKKTKKAPIALQCKRTVSSSVSLSLNRALGMVTHAMVDTTITAGLRPPFDSQYPSPFPKPHLCSGVGGEAAVLRTQAVRGRLTRRLDALSREPIESAKERKGGKKEGLGRIGGRVCLRCKSACRQENSHRLTPLRQGSAAIQTPNFRYRPHAAPGMGFRP